METKAPEINRNKLFWIGVIALFTAGMNASLRGAVARDIKTEYLDGIDLVNSGAMIAQSLAAAFLGFALTLFFASPFLNAVGMKRMLAVAALCFVGGCLCVVLSGTIATGASVSTLIWAGMFLTGVAWGCTEATINPMTTTLYPDEKTHRLNVLHAWWPAGIIVGGLIGYFMGSLNISWKVALGMGMVPAFVFAFMLIGTKFPQTERAAAGISFGDMLKEVIRRPSFLIWFVAMFMTAASELAPGQWVDLALSNIVGFRGILILVYVSALMFVMRHFAGVLVHRLSNPGLMMFSSALAACGLYLLSTAHSPASAFIAATVWGIGVCYMWPTMLASVAERYPRGGSWMIGLLGSAGAMSIYFVLPKLGTIYDKAQLQAAGSAEALERLTAEAVTNPEVMEPIMAAAATQSFRSIAVIPALLVFIFAGLWFYESKVAKAKPTKT
ncbi:MAG: MFS transporter [Robiginitomaculum sp.]|nr:MAG: MFS transporter [Robiginitomaculum sp.]